jgi:hypothetical protein
MMMMMMMMNKMSVSFQCSRDKVRVMMFHLCTEDLFFYVM